MIRHCNHVPDGYRGPTFEAENSEEQALLDQMYAAMKEVQRLYEEVLERVKP